MSKHLIDLKHDPRVTEAIRYFTDPLLPTFGKKAASARQAGTSVSVFARADVRKRITEIVEERSSQQDKVVEYLATYTMDAARELISQLSTGRDLELQDPSDLVKGVTAEDLREMSEFFTTDGEVDTKALERIIHQLDRDKLKAAEVLTKANKVALEATEQRRKAAIDMIRYAIGTPEQRIRVTKVEDENRPIDLSQVPDDKLEEMGQIINDMVDERRGPVVEAEIVEEETDG